MEERVRRFRDLIDKGRPYRVYELVLNELKLRFYYKNNWRATYEAHLGACFYDLPELDIDSGYIVKVKKHRG